MSQVTRDLTVSLDAFVAGPNQRLDKPLGDGGELLHRWMFEDREANAPEIEGILAAGAFIMGRNMFAGPGHCRGSADGTPVSFSRAHGRVAAPHFTLDPRCWRTIV